jgi:hypothetical protein
MAQTDTDILMPHHSDSPGAWAGFCTRVPPLFQQWPPDQPITIRIWTLDERRKTLPVPYAFRGCVQTISSAGVVLRVNGKAGTFPQFVSWADLWTGTAEVLTPAFAAALHTAWD